MNCDQGVDSAAGSFVQGEVMSRVGRRQLLFAAGLFPPVPLAFAEQAARALELMIPRSVLLPADRVIE